MSNKDEAFIDMLRDACGHEKPEPEPVIGPGLILERGRERLVVVSNERIELYRRPLWGAWPVKHSAVGNGGIVPYVRYALASGFRVIRKADTQTQEPGR